MEAEAAKARWHRLHEKRPWHDGTFTKWAEKPSAAYPFKYDMGVVIGVADTDLRPTDDFLTKELAPWPPPEAPSDAEEAPDGDTP